MHALKPTPMPYLLHQMHAGHPRAHPPASTFWIDYFGPSHPSVPVASAVVLAPTGPHAIRVAQRAGAAPPDTVPVLSELPGAAAPPPIYRARELDREDAIAAALSIARSAITRGLPLTFEQKPCQWPELSRDRENRIICIMPMFSGIWDSNREVTETA